MTSVIFDGKAFAQKKEGMLRSKVETIKAKGIIPKLVSIVIGDVDGAMKYQNMKKKAGERVGIEVEILEFREHDDPSKILARIKDLNKDTKVHGIMIQLPLPQNFSKENKETLIKAIGPKKDVDGMREESPFTAPVVKAVLYALEIASPDKLVRNDMRVVVVGAKGFEGRKMVKELVRQRYQVVEVDQETKDIKEKTQDADVIVSCTGAPGLITGNMVKQGAIVIDAGAPKGDVDFESVTPKASFITPVPGGIGPLTIACLMENIIHGTDI